MQTHRNVSNLLSDIKNWGGGGREWSWIPLKTPGSWWFLAAWNRTRIQTFCIKREKEGSTVMSYISETEVLLDDSCWLVHLMAGWADCWVCRQSRIQLKILCSFTERHPLISVLGKQGVASVGSGRGSRLVYWSRMHAS